MRSHDDIRAEAFERALGLEDSEGESPAEAAEREALEHRLAPLAGLLEPVRPGADLFARITSGLGLGLPLAGIHSVRADEGRWKPLCEGIETRTLWHSAKSRRHAFLLRMQPGSVLPEHDHSGDEECLLLEGDMVVNGVQFGPGDFQVAFAETKHPNVTTRGGCLCFITVQLAA